MFLRSSRAALLQLISGHNWPPPPGHRTPLVIRMSRRPAAVTARYCVTDVSCLRVCVLGADGASARVRVGRSRRCGDHVDVGRLQCRMQHAVQTRPHTAVSSRPSRLCRARDGSSWHQPPVVVDQRNTDTNNSAHCSLRLACVSVSIITARCTIVRVSSVRLSVRLSVTLLDHDHMPHRLKILEILRSQLAQHLRSL